MIFKDLASMVHDQGEIIGKKSLKRHFQQFLSKLRKKSPHLPPSKLPIVVGDSLVSFSD